MCKYTARRVRLHIPIFRGFHETEVSLQLLSPELAALSPSYQRRSFTTVCVPKFPLQSTQVLSSTQGSQPPAPLVTSTALSITPLPTAGASSPIPMGAAPHGIPLLFRDAPGGTSPLPTSRNRRLPEEPGSPGIPGLMELPCCLPALGTRPCCPLVFLILIRVNFWHHFRFVFAIHLYKKNIGTSWSLYTLHMYLVTNNYLLALPFNYLWSWLPI